MTFTFLYKNVLPRTVDYCSLNCMLNIGAKFQTFYKEIYTKKLVPNWDILDVTLFLDLDIAISNDVTTFLFLFHSGETFIGVFHHLLFYQLMMSEICCIAKSSSSASFCEKSSALITWMDTRWKWVRTCLTNFEILKITH